MKARKINRLNSQREEQRQQSRYLLLTTFSVLFLLGLVSWALVELHDPDTLPLKTVQVNGEFIHITDKQLQAVVMNNNLGGFFSTNVDAITESVLAMPWVERVTTRRVWPDELHITVYEQKAVAVWNQSALLNEKGEVFFPSEKQFPAGLPVLKGPKGMATQVLFKYQQMQSLLTTAGLSIKEAELDARRAWKLRLANNVQVIIGRQKSQQKLARFVSAYATLIHQQPLQIEQIDLRYTNGIAVNWKKTENNNTAESPVGMSRHVQKS